MAEERAAIMAEKMAVEMAEERVAKLADFQALRPCQLFQKRPAFIIHLSVPVTSLKISADTFPAVALLKYFKERAQLCPEILHVRSEHDEAMERQGDLVMKQYCNGQRFVVLALENQEKTDYAMPVRVMENGADTPAAASSMPAPSLYSYHQNRSSHADF